MDNPWRTYSEKTKELPPRKLLVKAMGYVQNKGRALDLGPGALNESKFLLEQGFESVVAVNKDSLDTDPIAKERAESFPQDHFHYRVSTFEDFNFEPDCYDLINAQYSLPFSPPATFEKMFASLITSLKVGGVVTGQFFGTKDEWNTGEKSMTFVTREEAGKLLSNCEILSFEEVEGTDRLAVGGQKYWHVFHFIARKK